MEMMVQHRAILPILMFKMEKVVPKPRLVLLFNVVVQATPMNRVVLVQEDPVGMIVHLVVPVVAATLVVAAVLTSTAVVGLLLLMVVAAVAAPTTMALHRTMSRATTLTLEWSPLSSAIKLRCSLF